MKLRCVLIFACVMALALTARAAEPSPIADVAAHSSAVKLLSSLHVSIVDGRFDATWVGPSPGMRATGMDIKAFVLNPDKRTLLLNVVEQEVDGRELSLNVTGAQAELKLQSPADKRVVEFHQNDDGVTLSFNGGAPLKEKSFHDLAMRSTGELQGNLLHALADLGVTIDPSPDLPVVMALAVSGYSQAAPAMAEKVKALVGDLASPDPTARDKASATLKKMYPLAIKTITDLAASADDKTKAALNQVIQAHPGIAAVRAYVEEKGLQNDRKYLENIAAESPLLRDAAKQRLSMLPEK